MIYKKILQAYFNDEPIDKKYIDFADLKIARHSLSQLMAAKELDPDLELELKAILGHLNNIHSRNAYLEAEIEKLDL